MNTKTLILLTSALLLTAPRARSQEQTIALGRVNSAGDIVGSANPLGAVISGTRPSDGHYEITVAAPGAFTGDGVGDFLVQAMVRTTGLTDRACSSEVLSVDPDNLVVGVNIADMEDNTDLDAPEAANFSFQFAIHRLPAGTAVSPQSRYLYATGSVTNNGALKLGVTADGALVSASQNGIGDYRVRFEKAGAFGIGLDNYLVFASSGSSSSFSDNILSGAPSFTNGDALEFTIRGADVQNASNVNPEAEDEEFHFHVYRITDAETTGAAASRLLLGMASVQGDNGILRRGATSINDAFLTSERSGIGRYSVVLNAPGRFTGKIVDDFIIHAGINATDITDHSIIAEPFLVGPDSLTIAIRTNDLEDSGALIAVASDSDFFLMIHDANAVARPDLLTGKSAVPGKMRGDNRYSLNGVGQKLPLKAAATGRVRFHAAVQNDGNVADSIPFRGKGGAGLRRTRCYRMSGGKVNVTAAFRAGGDLSEGLRPTAATVYRIESNFPTDSSKTRTSLRLLARSQGTPALVDVSRVEVIRNP